MLDWIAKWSCRLKFDIHVICGQWKRVSPKWKLLCCWVHFCVAVVYDFLVRDFMSFVRADDELHGIINCAWMGICNGVIRWSERRILSISHCEEKYLVCTPVAHYGRDVPLSSSFVVLTPQLLSVIGGDAAIICCGGVNLDFIKAPDKGRGRKGSIQYFSV